MPTPVHVLHLRPYLRGCALTALSEAVLQLSLPRRSPLRQLQRCKQGASVKPRGLRLLGVCHSYSDLDPLLFHVDRISSACFVAAAINLVCSVKNAEMPSTR